MPQPNSLKTPDVSSLMQDSQFRTLQLSEQKQILKIADPKFASLPESDQDAILQQAFVGGVSTTRPSARPETAFSETKKQTTMWLQGIKQLLNFGGVGDPHPLGTLGWGLYNTAAGAGRELTGSAQPGKSAITAPSSLVGPITGRIPGAASTLLGGDPQEARAQLAMGGKGAAYSAMYAGPALNFGLNRLLRILLPESEPSIKSRALSLTRATGGGGKSVNIAEAYQTALPRLMETQKITRNVARNPVELAKLVGDTGRRLENEFGIRMQPIQGQQIMPTSVANALLAEAQKFATGIPDDEAIATRLRNAAIDFQHPQTLSNLNQIRMNARGRIASYLDKKPTAQMVQARTVGDVIADKIIHDTTRDIVYDTMERHYGRPDYFRNLKATQSAMLDITDQLAGRLNELGNDEAYDTLMDRVKGHSYVSSGGHVGIAIGRIMTAPISEKYRVNRAVRKGLQKPSNKARARVGTATSVAARQSQGTAAPDEE